MRLMAGGGDSRGGGGKRRGAARWRVRVVGVQVGSGTKAVCYEVNRAAVAIVLPRKAHSFQNRAVQPAMSDSDERCSPADAFSRPPTRPARQQGALVKRCMRLPSMSQCQEALKRRARKVGSAAGVGTLEVR